MIIDVDNSGDNDAAGGGIDEDDLNVDGNNVVCNLTF